MAEADSLRLVAEVVDKFSGPLKALRAQLQGMSKDGASHTEAVVKGFQKVESAAKSAGTTAATTLNPALAAIGITGLSVVAAMTGVGSALRSLGGSVSALAMLGRETGVSAENLRVLQSVMGKFGIEAEASAGAIKTFAQNMRLAKDGIGPIMEFLRTQGKTAEGRAYFNGLADSLKNSKDNGEALVKALEGLEHIQDPAGRMEYAQRLFGNADIGRLGDQHLGRLRDIIKKQREILGPLGPETVKAAEDFEKAMSSMRGTMQRLGTAIATEAMPYVSEFVKGIEGLVKDGRQDITGPLRQSVREVGEALKSIDWAQAGKDAKDFVTGTTQVIRDLLEAVQSVAKAIRSLNEGKYVEAFRHLDGGSGPLARKLAPLPGDDKIAHDEAVGKLRAEIERTKEQGQLQRGLQKESEDSGDRAKSAQMRSALELNSRRLKDLEEALRKLTDGTATVQQQSFDGTGTGLGGLIHRASFGGGGAPGSMARVGNLLAQRGGGIYLPSGGGGRGRGGGGGAPHADDEGASRGQGRGGEGAPDDRDWLRRRNFGGGRFNGLGGPAPRLRPGGPGERVGRWQRGEGAPGQDGRHSPREPGNPGQYRPEYELGDADLDQRVINKIAGEVSTKSPEGVDAVINNMLNRVGTKGWGPSKNLRDVALAPGQYAGNRAASAKETEFIRSRIRAIASGGVPDNTEGANSYRSEPYYQSTKNRGRGYWAGRAEIGPNVGGNRYAFEQGMPNGPYAPYDPKAIRSAPRPDGVSNDALPNGAPAVLRPKSMPGAPGVTMDEADRARAGRADGDGWAARERARKALEGNDFAADYRRRQDEADKKRIDFNAGSPAMSRALKAGAGGPVINNDGKVEVHVARPGPDTKVSTSASGNLFRDVQLRHGKTMAPASQGD